VNDSLVVVPSVKEKRIMLIVPSVDRIEFIPDF